MDTSTDSNFPALLESLRTAPTAPGNFSLPNPTCTELKIVQDAKAAADKIAREVSKVGLEALRYNP
jgi:hypothetical protein